MVLENTENHRDDPNFCGYWAHPRFRKALEKMQTELNMIAPQTSLDAAENPAQAAEGATNIDLELV